MQDKQNDIKYLGCDQEKIQNSNPILNEDYLKRYYSYVTERYEIYKKREQGLSKPWTNVPLFLNFKFTNVRREHDRTSKWLIDHISNNPELSYEDRFFRTILFRLYNKIETAEAIHMDSKDFWMRNIVEKNADILDNIPSDVYTRAYKTVSIKYRHKDKYPNHNYRSHTLLYVFDMIQRLSGMIPPAVETDAQSAFEWIKQIPGVGDFLGYQIFCDLTYINEYPISENEFTVAGPGCRAGIDLLFDNKDGMTYEECIFWIRDHFDEIMQRVNPGFSQYEMFNNLPEYDRHMNVQSIENNFCEFSKAIYIMEGRHKSPHKYNGRDGN